jgi:hypothetical protein
LDRAEVGVAGVLHIHLENNGVAHEGHATGRDRLRLVDGQLGAGQCFDRLNTSGMLRDCTIQSRRPGGVTATSMTAYVA